MYKISPHLILKNENKILLLKRNINLQIYNGYWHLPTGGIENDEDPKSAIIREAREEINIEVEPTLAAVVINESSDFLNAQSLYKDICMFFLSENYNGEVKNLEPSFHMEMDWFDINFLPEPVVPVVKYGLKCFDESILYSMFKAF